MPESLPGLIKGNLFWAGGWERKETVGHGSSIAMHWAEPACAPRAKPCRGNRECWKPRGLNRDGWPLRTSCAPQTSVSATLLRQTEWRCPGLGPANSCTITAPSKLRRSDRVGISDPTGDLGTAMAWLKPTALLQSSPPFGDGAWRTRLGLPRCDGT